MHLKFDVEVENGGAYVDASSTVCKLAIYIAASARNTEATRNWGRQNQFIEFYP
jgi:hypothetical protein